MTPEEKAIRKASAALKSPLTGPERNLAKATYLAVTGDADIKVALKELDSLRRDAARLDYLESHGTQKLFKIGKNWYSRDSQDLPSMHYKNFRDAVDAAMGGAQE